MSLTELSLSEIEALLVSLKEPRFRAQQIQKWVFKQLATSYDEMSDLPLRLRESLQSLIAVTSLSPVATESSSDNRTNKVLFRLSDGRLIESVLMSYDPAEVERQRRTVCVSTQVGCGYGCAFCATGAGGLSRNLTTGEIVDQVLYFDRELRDSSSESATERSKKAERRISNVVFMGMGEPMANYKATIKAIEILNDPAGYNLGSRHMTISTVGIIPGIAKLAREGLQIGLAVSLHAPNQKLRERLVPVAKRYPLPTLLMACREYIEMTGRRVTFEYGLAAGVNDSPEQARELAALLTGLICHVNLIPVNPSETNQFRPSPPQSVRAFQAVLASRGIAVTVRVERGVDIQAACGQLRARVGERAPESV